jgi:hypothetical protein
VLFVWPQRGQAHHRRQWIYSGWWWWAAPTMEFCDQCHNMLYTKTSEAGGLVRCCVRCGATVELPPTSADAVCVLQTLHCEDAMLFSQINTAYLRHDPTLPRIEDPAVRCPSQRCCGPGTPSRVIYVRYNHSAMQYCDWCGHVWRPTETTM